MLTRPNSISTPSTYFPVLDAVRGFAILIVMLFHLFDSVSLFRLGWIGVDLFFVLSGFLITNILLKAKGKPAFFKNFYGRRFLRTFPLYYLTIAVFFLAGKYFFSNTEGTIFHFYRKHQLWYCLMGQNWLLIKEGSPSVPYLVHLWSLAVEEQFYLVWPVIIYLCSNFKITKRVLIFLFCLSVLYRTDICFSNSIRFEAYYHDTFARADSLLAGSFLALIRIEGKLIPTYIITLVLSAWIGMLIYLYYVQGNINPDSLLMGTIGYSVTAIAFTCILYILLNSDAIKEAKFSKANPIIFLGKISYGLYIFHIPVYLVIAKLMTSAYNVDLITVGIFSLAFTIFISTASYHMIEKPILSLKRYFQ